jgi:hypothetical protein
MRLIHVVTATSDPIVPVLVMEPTGMRLTRPMRGEEIGLCLWLMVIHRSTPSPTTDTEADHHYVRSIGVLVTVTHRVRVHIAEHLAIDQVVVTPPRSSNIVPTRPVPLTPTLDNGGAMIRASK